jgi:asparagine synthase (glutamine-hydrolysing)
MCGLTGILSSSSSNEISKNIIKMTSPIKHRGPDDNGIWTEENIGFGHRRLSVLDLSVSGAQPMHSKCGRYVIVYNGEIYNHLEIRKNLEIENASINWIGHSDTETLLTAIQHWGLDKSLKNSNGMFALALWDKKTKSLSLARDRIGEKPLYWGWAGKDFVFGSELKALRVHPNFSRDICRKALVQFLRFTYVPAPRSIYKNIYKIEPGTILTINNFQSIKKPKDPIRPGEIYENIYIRRFWDLNNEVENGASNQIDDEKEAVNSIEKVLSKAVSRQMISDVPIGAFLSGGVDSSTIVALMQTQSSRRIQTFTVGFDEASYDESNHAATVAKYLGTDHNKIVVTNIDALKVIPDLPWLYDEPFADSSQIATHLICRSARKHVTVALSGDGGDEIFGGYNRYIHGPALWKYISFFNPQIRNNISKLVQKIPQNSIDKFGKLYNHFRTGDNKISNMGNKIHRLADRICLIDSLEGLHRNMVSAWIKPEELLKEDVKEPKSLIDDLLPRFAIKDPVLGMMIRDLRSYLPDDIFCKVDRAAMGVSLETRSPFLDKDLISLAMRLPTEMKIRDGRSKWGLRQVLYKHIPKKIIERPKEGFAVPVALWLRGPLREWAESLLSIKKLEQDGFFKSKIINRIWIEHLSGQKDWSTPLWTILMFQAWNTEQK